MAHEGDEPRVLADSLDSLLRSLKVGERRTVAGVFGQWEESVGPQVAGHARPVKLEQGRLIVEVDEPAWATQLQYLEQDLLSRIRATTGVEVASIEVRVSRRPGTPRW